MTVQGIATTLLLPPLVLVLLSLVAALAAIRAQGWARTLLCALVALAAVTQLVLATPFVAGHLAASLQRPDAWPGPDPAQPPGAIVVLGADAARSRTAVEAGALTLERLRAGAALARRTGLPLLVTAGPLGPGEPPLAALMAAALRDDFALGARWIEPTAADTRENAQRSAAILSGEGISTAHVVTHAWHMPRALAAFDRAGLGAIPAPVRLDRVPSGIATDFIPRTDHLHRSWLMLREWAGGLVYALRDPAEGGRQ